MCVLCRIPTQVVNINWVFQVVAYVLICLMIFVKRFDLLVRAIVFHVFGARKFPVRLCYRAMKAPMVYVYITIDARAHYMLVVPCSTKYVAFCRNAFAFAFCSTKIVVCALRRTCFGNAQDTVARHGKGGQ